MRVLAVVLKHEFGSCRLLAYTSHRVSMETTMSFFRARFGVVQRSNGGSAIRRAAYQSCGRLEAPDGRIFDWTKEKEAHGHVQTIMFVPPGSPDWTLNVQTCWTKAVLAERRIDAQEARTMEISLPRDLPMNQLEGCVRALVAPFVAAGMIVQADIHISRAADGGANPHVHCLMSMRRIEGNHFARKKSRDWNTLFYGDPKKQRCEIAARLNDYCTRFEIDYHANAASNQERGLPIAEPTIPRWNILLAKRTGRLTKWMHERNEVRAMRQRIAMLERALADVNDELARRRAHEQRPSLTVAADGNDIRSAIRAAARMMPQSTVDRRKRPGRRLGLRNQAPPSRLYVSEDAIHDDAVHPPPGLPI
jgi:MobA/MobL family